MSDPNPKPQAQIKIDIGEKEAEGIYSNIVFISHSPSEFILDFARALPGLKGTKVFARILMTPQHAKALKLTLEKNVSKFEEQFGEIKIHGPGALDPRALHTEPGEDKIN